MGNLYEININILPTIINPTSTAKIVYNSLFQSCIKEKLLAATRAGIKEVILCEANRKDVEEIKQDYLKNIKIHFVNSMSEVIDLAIEK